MTRTLALLLACCLPLAACTQSSTPPAASAQAAADPAQLALDAWLEAFNSGERAQLEVFRDRWKPGMDVDELLELHAETGGFRLVRREPSARMSDSMVMASAGQTASHSLQAMQRSSPLS